MALILNSKRANSSLFKVKWTAGGLILKTVYWDIVGYTFSEEFAGSLCTLIEPNQPSLVTIEAVCDSKIYYLPYSKLEDFFATNAETVQIKCALVEQSYSLMYHRLLDMYCKTTEELYLDLLNRCPDIQEYITLKEIASFLRVTPETVSRIRRKLKK